MCLTRTASLAVGLLLLVLAVNKANAQLSLTFVFNENLGGIILGATGSANATMTYGNIRAYGGSVPAGVTRTVNGTSSWALTTPLNIDVLATGIVVPSYTLTAKLMTADAVNTWMVNSSSLATTSTTLTTTGVYNVNTPYTISLTIPFSEPPGAIGNTIIFTATGN